MRSIAYYITAHGYGHGVRSMDAVRALMEHSPETPIHLVTCLPPDFLLNRLPRRPASIRSVALDVGMVQLDSVRVDVPATLGRVQDLVDNHQALFRREVQWQDEVGAGVVVCDIPSIPLEAAKARGVPALATGNFSWDWIYQPFVTADARWARAVAMFEQGYRSADLLMKMPFAPAMEVFEHQRDISLLSRPAVSVRDEMVQRLGCDADKPWLLLSFTSLDLDPAAVQRIRDISSWEFFTVKPLKWEGDNLHAVDREVFRFDQVLASCDAVLTKPGYGILSECVVNQKPIIYTERTDFVEYPVLEAALKKHLKHVHIPSEMLYAGALEKSLAALSHAPDPGEPLGAGGDVEAAEIIITYLEA